MLGPEQSPDLPPWLAVGLLALLTAAVVVVLWCYFAGLYRREKALASFAAERGLSFRRRLSPLPASHWDHVLFASAQDAAFLAELGGSIASGDRGIGVLNVVQGKWEGKRWFIFDRSCRMMVRVRWDPALATLVVLDTGAAMPRLVVTPDGEDLMEWMTPHADDADVREDFSVEADSRGDARTMLNDTLRRELADSLTGPLRRSWRLFTEGSRLIVWFDGIASVPQIAEAMRVMADVHDRIQAL